MGNHYNVNNQRLLLGDRW